MTIEQLVELFGWMTILNIILYLFSIVVVLALRSFIVRFHSKIFDIESKNIFIFIYGWLGVYKIGIIFFNLIPYIALKLIV